MRRYLLLWHTPNGDNTVPAHPLTRWFRLIRPQDIVWLLLFVLLGITSEIRDGWVYSMLAALAAVQVLETKVPALATTTGRVLGLVVKFVLCFLLIGYTFGIQSRFWLLLL